MPHCFGLSKWIELGSLRLILLSYLSSLSILTLFGLEDVAKMAVCKCLGCHFLAKIKGGSHVLCGGSELGRVFSYEKTLKSE